MELRHLRCFLAVAEELHFARAAQRLHIDQSPLSRTIRELEDELGAQLFVRNTRSTRLTRAGQLLMEEAPRVFAAIDRARDTVKGVAAGCHGQLFIALSDGVAPPWLASLLAQCRQEDPDVALRFAQVPWAQQLRGLQEELYDVGFAKSSDVGDGLIAEPAWSEALHVALPLRHPLLAHPQIPLEEALAYPLVLMDPDFCQGYARQVERILRKSEHEPLVSEYVSSFDLMVTLVCAGFAVGIAGASQIAAAQSHGVVGRPLAGRIAPLKTWLIRRDEIPSEPLARLIERVRVPQSSEQITPRESLQNDSLVT